MRPKLLCIEGAAGVGKTTLCHTLQRRLAKQDQPCKVVAEFSTDPAGQRLAHALQRGNSKPSWINAETEFFSCISNKFQCFSALSQASQQVLLIADRGFVTQAILGIPPLKEASTRHFAHKMLQYCHAWLLENFAVTSLLLTLPESTLQARLEKRLQRLCTEKEALCLRAEAYLYHHLPEQYPELSWQVIDASAPPSILASKISDFFLKEHS